MFFIHQLRRRSILPQRSPQRPRDRQLQPRPEAREAIARAQSDYFIERRSVL